MKTMKKSILLVIVMLAFGISSFAQISRTANATAVILAPLTVTKTVDLDFGSIASSTGGNVIVATDNNRTASGAGVSLIGGTPTAAAFDITGEPSRTITVVTPTLPVVLTGSVSGTMNISAVSSNPDVSGGTTILPVSGAVTLNLGATLVVGAAQPAGTYTNTTDFTVTVNYQ
jgi:hypothetical protein